MYKYEITKRIEEFAPLETQEDWDCSGWLVDVEDCNNIDKVMLCLTVTNDVVRQAKEQNCDMIISHHPLFFIPFNHLTFQPFNEINIYCAHTNLDKAKGGTTDTIIEKLDLKKYKIDIKHDFLRMVELKITVNDFSKLLKKNFPNARLINPHPNPLPEREGVSCPLHKIAFCAGSGSEFINDAKELGADCLVNHFINC